MSILSKNVQVFFSLPTKYLRYLYAGTTNRGMLNSDRCRININVLSLSFSHTPVHAYSNQSVLVVSVFSFFCTSILKTRLSSRCTLNQFNNNFIQFATQYLSRGYIQRFPRIVLNSLFFLYLSLPLSLALILVLRSHIPLTHSVIINS